MYDAMDRIICRHYLATLAIDICFIFAENGVMDEIDSFTVSNKLIITRPPAQLPLACCSYLRHHI